MHKADGVPVHDN